MDQVQLIRQLVLVDGQSQRDVAQLVGVSRNTVRRYLRLPEPKRAEQGPRARPVSSRMEPRIDELLEAWRGRLTPKQRVTGMRLHQQLVEEGYQVSLTLVRTYLREIRRRAAEVFIPLVHRAGDEAQVDFFEVTVEIAGQQRKAWKLLLRLMYSGRDFVWLYDRCDQIAFLDGHVRAFAYLQGVPHRCVYDNLSAAVRRLVGSQRQLTPRFAALVSHYLFEPCFTRVGQGHDKGGVESRGKGIRLQHLTPVPRGDSLVALAQALLHDIERSSEQRADTTGRTVQERFAEERPQLLPLPPAPFDARRVVLVSVSSKALVKLEGAWYSVPSSWARSDATAYVGPEEVHLVRGDQVITHPRQPFGQRRIRYRHYLAELCRKPQAVRQVAPELLAELGEPYGQLWQLLVESHGAREAGRVLARVLGAIVDHGEPAVQAALQQALATNRVDLLALSALQAPAVPQTIPIPVALAGYEIEAARAADYDVLLTGELT